MSFAQSPQYAAAEAFRLPRWNQLPVLSLYMDQLLAYVNGVLTPLADPENGELLLTKSMVNNYVKQKVLPPPDKKRYSRSHLATLLLLCTLKQVFSIPECLGLQALLFPGGTIQPEGWDAFGTALEQALTACFAGRPHKTDTDTEALTALLAGKLYFQKRLEYNESRKK